ncbi:hypothetical protein C8K44_1371, partial [Aminobacter sp. AP02]
DGDLGTFGDDVGRRPAVNGSHRHHSRFRRIDDLSAYEIFLKTKLTRLEGVASIETSFALGQTKRSEVLPLSQL